MTDTAASVAAETPAVEQDTLAANETKAPVIQYVTNPDATDQNGLFNPNLLHTATLLLGMVLGAIAMHIVPQYTIDWSKFSLPTLTYVGQASTPVATIPVVQAALPAPQPTSPQNLAATAPTREEVLATKLQECLKTIPPKDYVMHFNVAAGHLNPWTDTKCTKVRLKKN